MSDPRPRWRDLAGPVGLLPTGARNSITDVPGVLVGHARAGSGDHTGVTVVVPPRLPAFAGATTINGTGELTGKLEVDELGVMGTPVHLCGSHAVGTVLTAAIDAAGGGPGNIKLPIVGECDDSDMADSRVVTGADVRRALEAAGPECDEGTVGAGTGMSCYDYPGGIGTASRRVGEHTVGVLLLCNFGERAYLDLLGPDHARAPSRPAPHGSCIAVCATDAPLTPHELRRLALRPLLGLARTGSYAADGSGEIGLAFSTSAEWHREPLAIDGYFAAAYEAAREAVYNCLVAARPGTRLDGTRQDAFPTAQAAARWRAGLGASA